jgi:hypothetical protein
MTNRLFEVSSNTKVFTTHGRQNINIPDLIRASAVTLNSATLDQDSSFYLIPDHMNSGVFTAIDLPQYRDRFDYRSYPDWFDKNYDSPLYQNRLRSGIPNDLSIAGVWGHDPLPVEVSRATLVLAAWYTKNPDAVLSGTIQTPNGDTILIAPGGPDEVRMFVQQWKIEYDSAVAL